MSDKNKLNAKPKVPGLALKPATTAAPAIGGSATARAVLQNPRGVAKDGDQASRAPYLSSSGRSEADVDFFGMLNEAPPEGFKSGPNASVREDLLEEAALSFTDVLKLGPPSDAQNDKGNSTNVKGKKAEFEKLFITAAYSAKPVPGTPFKESREQRPVAERSASSSALRTGAAHADTSSASSTTTSSTTTTSTTSAKKGNPRDAMPALPNPPSGGRVRSGSQPTQLFPDLTGNPEGRGGLMPTKIIAVRSDYTAPRVTSTTPKPAPTTADQTNASSSMPATVDQSRKIAADAALRRLANIARSAHVTATSTSASTSKDIATYSSPPLAKVTRASDPKVCFANAAPPGWRFPSLVVFAGSWFVATQRYTQIGSRVGKSDGVLPAYESFLPGAPAEVAGDGKWSEVMVNFLRSADVANGAGKTLLTGAIANDIFRGEPKILWNGKEIHVYKPMSRFVGERLKTSRFFEYVNLVVKKIDDANETQRVQFASDIAQSFCSDNLLAKMPKDLVNELVHLDREVIKWAVDSGCASDDIAAVRRDVAIVFLVTKGTTALMTQGYGDTDSASAATSGSVLMRFGGLVAKAMKAVMTFPNSGKALSERILKMSLDQMMSEPSLVPDWKDRLEQLKLYENAQQVYENAQRRFHLLENSNTATTTSSSSTSTTAREDSSPGTKSNPKREIRRAGTAGKLLTPRDPDERSGSARAEKKRLLKDIYATPWFKNKPDELKKTIRGALRELDANKLSAEMVQEKAEKCVVDYQEKKRLITELSGKTWFKKIEGGDKYLSAALMQALEELDADGLNFPTVESMAKKYVMDYRTKSELIRAYTSTPTFEAMGADLKAAIFKSLLQLDADGLTEDKVKAAANKFASDMIGKWGRKSPQTSPDKASQDASEMSSLQSPSESEKKERS
ncbi:MAG: hypothetical protein JWR21_1190 [Herminiimonas sp.]|nr:hypothetical protein [Herminiimonas sp.]